MANFFVKNDAFFGQPFFKQKFFTDNDFFKEPFFGGEFGGGTQPPAVTKPAKPASLTETGVTKTDIQIAWAQVADAANYNVAITPAVTGFPKDISVTDVHFTGLTAATAYTIKVKACNTAGCSVATQKTVTTAT